MRGPLGSRGRGCLGGVGNRTVYIWREKKRAMVESDGEEAIGKEEEMPQETTTGQK